MIKLTGNNVLLRLIAPVNQTKSGLYIPETAKRRDDEAWTATVIATGPGALNTETGGRIPCEVKPGDEVQLSWFGGKVAQANWPDDNHRIVDEDRIQAIL